VEKNLKGYRNIYVVGANPDFLQNVIHVPAEDVFDPAVNADGNMTLKILKACAISELSDNFLFMNDDFVFIKPIVAAEIPWMHKGDMANRPEAFWKAQFYRKRLLRTFETLRNRDETTLQYDYHAPMLMNKIKFKEVMAEYNWQEGIGLTFRSIYGNTMKLPAEHLTDQKKTVYSQLSLDKLTDKIKPAIFLGYNDLGLSKSLIYFLAKNFPERSEFEKTDMEDRTVEITLWLDGERDFKEGVRLFKKYMHGVNLIRMFEAGETPSMRKKLEYKLERTLDDLK
jgi:hypothetical protein